MGEHYAGALAYADDITLISPSLTCLRTRCKRGVRIVFFVARMRSSNSARMNKFDFTAEKIGSVHMTVFEIVAHCNVDNWTQLLK